MFGVWLEHNVWGQHKTVKGKAFHEAFRSLSSGVLSISSFYLGTSACNPNIIARVISKTWQTNSIVPGSPALVSLAIEVIQGGSQGRREGAPSALWFQTPESLNREVIPEVSLSNTFTKAKDRCAWLLLYFPYMLTSHTCTTFPCIFSSVTKVTETNLYWTKWQVPSRCSKSAALDPCVNCRIFPFPFRQIYISWKLIFILEVCTRVTKQELEPRLSDQKSFTFCYISALNIS